MNRRSTWLLIVSAVFVVPVLLGGCIFAADLINPAAITALGLDPNSINRPVGTVLVVFVNDSDQPAVFTAFLQTDPQDINTARTIQIIVDPNSNTNEVLSCPTGQVSLGTPRLVDPVLEGVDYLCGDLIEYRVGADFVVTAQIIPGR